MTYDEIGEKNFVPPTMWVISRMVCSDSPCVVPAGDFGIFAIGPGAEAPGWPYVVPRRGLLNLLANSSRFLLAINDSMGG